MFIIFTVAVARVHASDNRYGRADGGPARSGSSRCDVSNQTMNVPGGLVAFHMTINAAADNDTTMQWLRLY